MPIPRLLLLSRRSLLRNPEGIKNYLNGLDVQMAIALAPEDAEAAKAITGVVAQFQHTTAIVADFVADIAVCDDGSVDTIGYTPVIEPKDSPIITEA